MHISEAINKLNECVREEKQDGKSDAVKIRWWKFDDVIANGIFGLDHIDVSFDDGTVFERSEALLLRECGTLVAVQTIPKHIREQAMTVTTQANDIAEDKVPLWILDQAILRLHANSKHLKNLVKWYHEAESRDEEQYFVTMEMQKEIHGRS